jgi:hypothetical protein
MKTVHRKVGVMDNAKGLNGCKHYWLGLAIPFRYGETAPQQEETIV